MGQCLTNSILTSADSSIISLFNSATDFTIEYWQYVPYNANVGPAIYLFSQNNDTGYVQIVIDYSSPYYRNGVSVILKIQYDRTSIIKCATYDYAASVPPNKWNHIAFCRYGSKLYLYINGSLTTSRDISKYPGIHGSSNPIILNTTQISMSNFKIYPYAKYTANFILFTGGSRLFEDSFKNYYGRMN